MITIFHNCSSSWERGEGGFEHFKFKLASEPPIIPISISLMVPHMTFSLCSFFLILFLYFYYSNLTVSIDPLSGSLILSSPYSILQLSPSIEFFIPVFVVFSARISVWFHFIILISSLIFFIW